MSDDTAPAPDLRDLMAEALTVSFTGHPQRRFQALAANRVLADRMWPPVQAALDQRDAEIERLRAGESEQPAPDGQELAPAEWIHKFNRVTAEERIAHIEVMLSLSRQATVCWEQDHASLKERIHAANEELLAAVGEQDQLKATVDRVREAIRNERAAARRIVDEGRDQGGAWVNLMHSCAMFLMALDQPGES